MVLLIRLHYVVGKSTLIDHARSSTSSSQKLQHKRPSDTDYVRYSIHTNGMSDRHPLPRRFNVKVGKFGLAKLLLKETLQYLPRAILRGSSGVREALEVITARPCVYGVFSGPLGGFSPRPDLCVGCLRCTIQHPKFVRVLPNPERSLLGDSFLSFQQIGTIDEEAASGHVPVRGQGFRGRFGGPGWDGMWTDMSEIVRPTRDGIHGREFISTSIDIGSKPMHLTFDSEGLISSLKPRVLKLQVPFIFDPPLPSNADQELNEIWANTVENLDSIALFHHDVIEERARWNPWSAPIISTADWAEGWRPPKEVRYAEVEGNPVELSSLDPGAGGLIVGARISFSDGIADEIRMLHGAGWRTIHLVSNLHGMTTGGSFVLDALTQLHLDLVRFGIRDQITLIHTGGIVAAEHVAKAILCGADAVALDLPLHIAAQGRAEGDLSTRGTFAMSMPNAMDTEWGVQRLLNMCAAWRDQLLELLGAMGLREVRRLRGEHGRRMLQSDLEEDAFKDIPGFGEGA